VTTTDFEKFEPITKGPIVAVLWLFALAVVAGFYVIGGKIIALSKRKASS
jgi:hypothetical protein